MNIFKCVCLIFFFVSSILNAQDNNKYKVSEISLDSEQPGDIEELRFVRGGKFVNGGWQSVDSLNYIMISLKDGFEYDEPGAIELEMTNLKPEVQCTGGKHHFLNLYANPEGSHFFREYNNGEFTNYIKPSLPFFTLRFGKEKYVDKNGQGIKVLWFSGKERKERAPFGTRCNWDISKTYVWKVEWDADSISVFMNGDRIFGPEEFSNRDKDAPMRYIWIAKDGYFREMGWFGFAGPVYKKLRVYREISSDKVECNMSEPLRIKNNKQN